MRKFKALRGMKRTKHFLSGASLLFLCMGFLVSSTVGADTGSCVSLQKGKVMGCVEFSSAGALPGGFAVACPSGGTMQWVTGPCPRENALSACQIPRKDTITHISYCYQKYTGKDLPLSQAVAYCKQSCRGTFTPLGAAGGGGSLSGSSSQGAGATTGAVVAGGRETGKDYVNIAGVWSSGEGDIRFTQSLRQVKGAYPTDNGEIIGTMNGTVLEGYWIEDDASQRCDTPRNGRSFWGPLRFTFAGDTFEGLYGYCNGRPDQRWDGRRK